MCLFVFFLPVVRYTGKAYAPEFYYDTYSPLWQNRPRIYDFKLQWTQMNPNAVDRIVAYRLGLRQVAIPYPNLQFCCYFFVTFQIRKNRFLMYAGC